MQRRKKKRAKPSAPIPTLEPVPETAAQKLAQLITAEVKGRILTNVGPKAAIAAVYEEGAVVNTCYRWTTPNDLSRIIQIAYLSGFNK